MVADPSRKRRGLKVSLEVGSVKQLAYPIVGNHDGSDRKGGDDQRWG